MPEKVITEHPEFKWGMTFQEFMGFIFPPDLGTVAMCTGVRTQESLRRLKAVSLKKNDNYISSTGHGHGNVKHCHPIYDWSSVDVWSLVREWGLDYNKTYDVFNRTRNYNKLLTQRVCPPFGEEPLRGLWVYAECFPDMWHKMLNRVKGVATAWRYANTELYGVGKLTKPDNLSWRKYSEILIDQYSGKDKKDVIKAVKSITGRHYQKTYDEIPDIESHPLTGTSWKFLAQIIMKGDFKQRSSPKLEGYAIAASKKLGIKSREEGDKIYGKSARK